MLPIHLWQKLKFHDKLIILWWCRWLHFRHRLLPDSHTGGFEIHPAFPSPDTPLVKVVHGQLYILSAWAHLFPSGS